MSGEDIKAGDLSSVPGSAQAVELLRDVRHMIEQTRQQIAGAVNAGLTLLYWRVGKRISGAVLGGERAAYGREIIATLSRGLESEYGRGFAEKNLRRMM